MLRYANIQANMNILILHDTDIDPNCLEKLERTCKKKKSKNTVHHSDPLNIVHYIDESCDFKSEQ